jgi:hypothetical protein
VNLDAGDAFAGKVDTDTDTFRDSQYG